MCDCYHEAVADPTWVVNNNNSLMVCAYFLVEDYKVYIGTVKIATKHDMCSVQQQQMCYKSW